MSYLIDDREGAVRLLMGNEAIVRGGLEAGVHVTTGYPGTPSSEIVEAFAKVAKERNIYAECPSTRRSPWKRPPRPPSPASVLCAS
jgi:indolepyruvate ferredoxin oxidoreductase alpha subunit